MPEYSIDFSENLIVAAQAVHENDEDSVDSSRTVLYLSLLACESKPLYPVRQMFNPLIDMGDKISILIFFVYFGLITPCRK